MNRNNIITQINNLFDENIQLKSELQTQKQYYDNIMRKDEKSDTIYIMNAIERKIYDIGFKHLFEEGFNPYYSMNAYGSDKFYSFEDWIDLSINLNGFDDMSKNEFINLFSEKMQIEYNKRLAKAKEKREEK